jgi:hypothetical protein
MNTNTHFYHISLSSSYNKKYVKKLVVKKHKTYFQSLFFFENSAVYIMWANTVDLCICTAFWIPKAESPRSKCAVLSAFPLQK